MTKRFRTFRMEQLEARQMMAGDLDVSFTTENFGVDTLVVREATGQVGRDNSVFIKQMSGDTIRVIGTANVDGSLSLINGKQYQDFKVTPMNAGRRPIQIDVDLGGGNDTVNVTDFSGTGPMFGTFFLQNVVIDVTDTGDIGQDSVYLSHLDVGDNIGRIRITTGAGNDIVSLDDVSANNEEWGALGIGTGAGADRVEVYNSSFVGDVGIGTGDAAEAEVDDVRIVNVSLGGGNSDMEVTLGGGNDTFLFDGVTLPEPDHGWVTEFLLDTGAGNDTGSIKNVSAYRVKTLLGDGSDTLALDYIRAREMDLQGQEGSGDTLTKNHITVDQVFESGWETINGLPTLKPGLITSGTLQINPTTPPTFNPTTLPTLRRLVRI